MLKTHVSQLSVNVWFGKLILHGENVKIVHILIKEKKINKWFDTAVILPRDFLDIFVHFYILIIYLITKVTNIWETLTRLNEKKVWSCLKPFQVFLLWPVVDNLVMVGQGPHRLQISNAGCMKRGDQHVSSAAFAVGEVLMSMSVSCSWEVTLMRGALWQSWWWPRPLAGELWRRLVAWPLWQQRYLSALGTATDPPGNGLMAFIV